LNFDNIIEEEKELSAGTEDLEPIDEIDPIDNKKFM
jgi:hypothetical protein